MKYFLTVLAFLLALAFMFSCNDDKNSERPAYDSIPVCVNDSLMFSYSFHTGYQTEDTFYLLEIDEDTLQMQIRISDYKSGYLDLALYAADTTLLWFSRLRNDMDTTFQSYFPAPPVLIMMTTDRFTASYFISMSRPDSVSGK